MRADYSTLFQELQTELTGAGFEYSVIEETELTAVLLLSTGWTLVFEGERYYGPAFSIFVAPKLEDVKAEQRFAVFLLMRVFENRSGKNYGKPSIRNQILFLAEEKFHIFSDLKDYELDYKHLNEK